MSAENTPVGDRRHLRPVLVGYDGSPASERALRWAVEEAVLRGLPLTICHAWHWPYPFRPAEPAAFGAVKEAAAAVLADGVAEARELAGDLDIRQRLVKGATPAALLEAGAESAMLVLGSRGHGGFEELRVGSAAIQVPAHATHPVIVVSPTLAPMGRHGAQIVVGVDGSPASEAALEFAFETAELRSGVITAVCSWWDPGVLPGPDRAPFTDLDLIKQDAKTRFEQTIDSWRDKFPGVVALTNFVVEMPRWALTRAAQGADLLVVGNRGVGSVPEMLLGPVAQAALHEAQCAVAVVPAPVPEAIPPRD